MLPKIKPGRWLTSGGKIAIVRSERAPSGWRGEIPGEFTSTWWHKDGRHNCFPEFDLRCRISNLPTTPVEGRC
jgi:hypothetical protein